MTRWNIIGAVLLYNILTAPIAAASDCESLNRILAYERGPGTLVGKEMTLMLRKLVDESNYNSFRKMLRDCAPQFKEDPLPSDPLRRGTWDAQLTRSRVIIYEDKENQTFPDIHVLIRPF